jgi:ABC-2 type transport system ATP-binding protein
MNATLDFSNVSRSYKPKVPVLQDITFRIDPGEIIGLLGRNGAGKTTLIHLAMGMLHPDAGSVQVFGRNPTKHPVEVKRRIGYVAENQILPGMVGLAGLIALHRKLFPQWDDALERQLIDRFGLPLKTAIMSLSKGQARQAALLLAVCHRPELLILDEPAAGLDPVARREFLETAIQLLNREGAAIIFSSHHMSDVERLGGRILLLDKGRIRLDSELDTLKEELCLAVFPEVSEPTTRQLQGLPGYLHLRTVPGFCHVVFRGSPLAVEEKVHHTIGVNGIRVVRMPLEDLFIEMVGDSADGVQR